MCTFSAASQKVFNSLKMFATKKSHTSLEHQMSPAQKDCFQQKYTFTLKLSRSVNINDLLSF